MAVAVVFAAAFAIGGCDAAPTRPERSTRTHRVTVDAEVSPQGMVAVRFNVAFTRRDGGPVGVRAPILTTASKITIDGAPRSESVTDGVTQVRLRSRRGQVAFDLEGAVERYVDVAVITVPVWTAPEDAGRGDPPIPIEGAVRLPAPPVADAAFVHGAPDGAVRIEGSRVTFSATASSRHSVDVVLVVPGDAVPEAAVLPGAARREYVIERQADQSAIDRELAKDLADDARRDDLVAAGYWVLVGMEVALPFLVAGPRLVRTAARRRQAVAGVPDRLVDPPDTQPPAVVALLAGDGHDVGYEALAATILDLADRGVIGLEGPTSDRYRLRLSRASDGIRSPMDQVVVDALLEAEPATGHEGPPLRLDPDAPWWSALRRATLRAAKDAGFVQRRYPSGAFLTSVLLLTATTIPLWGRTPEAAVGGLVVAGILCMLPFVGGYVLSQAGHRCRAEWEAFGRRALESSEIDTAPAPAIAIWGPYLSYGAALGIAPAAVRHLSPKGKPR